MKMNEKCSCGSGHKYKKCCWKIGEKERRQKGLARLNETFNVDYVQMVNRHGRKRERFVWWKNLKLDTPQTMCYI